MIPEDILTALIVLFVVVVPFVAMAGLGAKIAAKRARPGGVDPNETQHRATPRFHRDPRCGVRAPSAPVVALAEHRANLPKLTPAPIRPDVRGPCDEPAAFSRGGEG